MRYRRMVYLLTVARRILLTAEQFAKAGWFEISFASALLLPPAMIEIL
jgi:hypothetical protein